MLAMARVVVGELPAAAGQAPLFHIESFDVADAQLVQSDR